MIPVVPLYLSRVFRDLMTTLRFVFQVIGLCFLASLAYKNAYQFVYSTNDSIVVQANKILESSLNQSYACATAKFMEITGARNTTRLSERASSATVSEALGSSVASGGSLLQLLSIDQFMAYDEYWVPGEDAPVLQEVLYDFTIDSIYGCLGQYEVSV